jgi:hypothetical protein
VKSNREKMRKYNNILFSLLIIAVSVLVFTKCRKQEYVVVYSKVSTLRAYNATSTTITVEGSIDSLTSAAHDEYGFCLDTLTNPTVYKQKLLASGIVQMGIFSGSVTGLTPARTYHVRAFIKDNKKYLYGLDVSFTTTVAVLPTVTTNSITNILAKTATCGGEVTKEGDRSVVAKGVCYDTVSSPTIMKNKTTDGWGTGTFTSNLVNLVPNKVYYARAYAVSEFGVAYGSQKTFTTKNVLYSFHEDFTDNKNNWDVGSFTGGSSTISEGQYEISYQQSGYLWTAYNRFPDFKSITSKDFELSTSIKIYPFNPLNILGSTYSGGLIWNADDSHFRYFVVKKISTRVGPSFSYTYSYQIGTYDGSYTIWKDYTSFTGTDSIKLTIKKANSTFYFFINDSQVYTHSYSSTTYDGVGFIVEDSKIMAAYLYIDQKDYKKSGDTETIKMKSLPGGHNVIRSFKK